MLTVEILAPELTAGRDDLNLRGFRSWWLKKVRSFDDSVHGGRCLVGGYSPAISAQMPTGRPVRIVGADAGDVFYLCGMALSGEPAKHFNLALRVDADAPTFELSLYTGQRVRIAGAVAIPFDDGRARDLYAGLPEKFLSCRNFQFGAQHFIKD